MAGFRKSSLFKSLCVPLDGSRRPLCGFSGARHREFRQPAPGFSLCERCPAAVTNDQVSIVAVHTRNRWRKPTRVVPGLYKDTIKNILTLHGEDMCNGSAK